jgi:hypothetical protein
MVKLFIKKGKFTLIIFEKKGFYVTICENKKDGLNVTKGIKG